MDQDLVFLSYSSPDRDRVAVFFDQLRRAGLHPWMDVRQLKAGQNWDFEIKRALAKASIVVVFLSAHSVDRRGYAQREIRIALDQAEERLIDDIYVIPVLLDPDVPIPERLARIQVVRGEGQAAFVQLTDAIAAQFERMGREVARVQGEARLRWTLSSYQDSWDGLPGYDSRYELLRFTSEDYPHAPQMTEVMQGWLTEAVMAQRGVKHEQEPERLNFGKDRMFRTNSWEASCGEPKVRGRVVSVAYTIWWWGAGAAHPNSGFRTFAFTLDPVALIARLSDMFVDSDEALAIIKRETRRKLLGQEDEAAPGDRDEFELDEEWVLRGTEEWADFENFVFLEDGIEFRFGSYQVGPYASGLHFAAVSYKSLVKLLNKQFASVLEIDHLLHDPPPGEVAPEISAVAPVEPDRMSQAEPALGEASDRHSG